MGTFAGHVLPGAFFLLFGLWHSVDTYLRYFRSVKFPGSHPPYHSRTGVLVPRRGSQKRLFPLDATLRLLACIIGATGEAITGYKVWCHCMEPVNAQHIVMYSAFGVSSALSLLLNWGKSMNGGAVLRKSSGRLPFHLDCAGVAMAFSVEGFLFSWHLHGRDPMNAQVHTFLVSTIKACVALVVFEACVPREVIVGIARNGATMLQGTWFIHLGFILYPPEWSGLSLWDGDDHWKMMKATRLFGWHILSVFVALLAIGAAAHLRVERERGLNYRKVPKDMDEEEPMISQGLAST